MASRAKRWISTASSSASSPNSTPCRNGATIRCPEAYGNLFRSANARSPRWTTSVSASSAAAARQKTQPSCSSAVRMYSRRHGAHNGFVTPTLLPVFVDALAPGGFSRSRADDPRRGVVRAPVLGRDADPDAVDRAGRADLRGARAEPVRARHARAPRPPHELLQPRLPGARRGAAQPRRRLRRVLAPEGVAGGDDVARGRPRLPVGPGGGAPVARAGSGCAHARSARARLLGPDPA